MSPVILGSWVALTLSCYTLLLLSLILSWHRCTTVPLLAKPADYGKRHLRCTKRRHKWIATGWAVAIAIPPVTLLTIGQYQNQLAL